MPGLSKDDVKVEVTDDVLTISGERRDEHEETGEGYRHSEWRYGRFSRSVPLPEGVRPTTCNAPSRKALDQAGAETSVVSPKNDHVRGWNFTEWGDQLSVDVVVDRARPQDFDALLLPGGVI